MDAGLLEAVRPLDIVALVEPGFELDQHRDLFAQFGGFDEQIDHRRIRADPIEGHLDADDVRIGDGRPKKGLDGRERLKRVMDEPVVVPDFLEDLVDGGDGPDRLRRKGRVLELRPREARELHPIAKAEPVREPKDRVLLDLKVVDQDVQHAPRHRGLSLQHRQRAVPALAEPLVHRLEQIVGFVFLDDEVGIADHAKEVGAFHIGTGKQRLHVGPHRVFKPDEGLAVRREVRRQQQEPRQHVGQLHTREFRPAAMFDDDRQILAEIRNVRERMAGIECQRRQHRQYFARAIGFQIAGDAGRIVRRIEHMHAVLRQRGAKDARPAMRLAGQHVSGLAADDRQLLRCREAVRGSVLSPCAPLPQEGRRANHEEFVEIGRGDGEKFHPLEQRVSLVLRLRKHPAVERNPAQLSIDVERRIGEVDPAGRTWGTLCDDGARHKGQILAGEHHGRVNTRALITKT